MKILLKIYIIHQLTIKNLKNIMINILKSSMLSNEITILAYDALGLIYYA